MPPVREPHSASLLRKYNSTPTIVNQLEGAGPRLLLFLSAFFCIAALYAAFRFA